LRIVAIKLEKQVMEIMPLPLGLYRDDFQRLFNRQGAIPVKKRGTIASQAVI
jgi:hypothetical protein